MEQFGYIYCGDQIRQDAGHSSQLLPQNLHKHWASSVFTTQVWIAGLEAGVNPFHMLLIAAWQHRALGQQKLVMEYVGTMPPCIQVLGWTPR